MKLPVLDSLADTRIYLYYGNATAPAHDPEAVWTAGLISAWHLSQDPSAGNLGDIKDATVNRHHGQAESSMNAQDLVVGRVGLAIDFDGSNDLIDIPSTIDVGNRFTLSAWVNLDGGSGIKTIFSNSLSGLDKNGYRLFVNSGTTADRRILFETSNGNASTAMLAVTDINKITSGVWTHVAVVVDRMIGTARIFIDGVDETLSQNIRQDFQTASDCELGRMKDLFRWNGMLDEIEIASQKRPSQWILTSFTNQNDPGAFYMVGSQELAAP